MSTEHGPRVRRPVNTLAEFERDLAGNLCYERGTTAESASLQDAYWTLAVTVRDRLAHRRARTARANYLANPKFVYFARTRALGRPRSFPARFLTGVRAGDAGPAATRQCQEPSRPLATMRAAPVRDPQVKTLFQQPGQPPGGEPVVEEPTAGNYSSTNVTRRSTFHATIRRASPPCRSRPRNWCQTSQRSR